MMKLLDKTRVRKGRKRAVAKAIAIAAYAIFWKTADASAGNVTLAGELPTGEQLVAGQASVVRSGSSMDILQTTDKAILNWQSFNIGAQAKVEFHQPDANAVVLNRVLTADPTSINGTLKSNGQVFLVNPSGIIFGKGASVNVGSLVASTMSIGDRDFLAGTWHFDRNGSISGIVNHGSIVAADGGCVALFAPEVTSDGLISARLGSVMLASGESLTLSVGRDDLYRIAVDPSKVASAIENRGMIQADGGYVLMQASTAGELLGSVINNGGTVQARTAENRNGTIVLLGDMESGKVQVGGTLDASASEGGDGGFIETSAAHVRIDDGTNVTTFATNGNSGTWLIDPHDFTIAGDRTGTVTGGTPSGDISGATLQSALAAGNVTILSSQGSTASGSGDINVNDNVTWSRHTLTLTAARNININAVMSVRDTNPGDAIDASDARLVMNTATTNGTDTAVSGGTVLVGLTSSGFTGHVDFIRSGTGVLTINGQGYTIIKDISALQGIQSGLDGRYALGGTIDASSTATIGFNPIGNSTTKFTGVLDGLGHTINNLTINRPAADYVGLFGYVSNADIRNAGFINESVTGLGNVGGLAGYIDNTTVINVSGAGNVRGKTNAGGLAGTLVRSTITTSSNLGTVTGIGTDATSRAMYIGGLVGFVDLADASSSIVRSGSSGTVTSTVFTSAYDYAAENIGGLVGGTGINAAAITQRGLLTISGSWSSADVTGESYVGGLIGRSSAYITTDTSTGTTLKSYSTGKITGIANGSYSGPTGSYTPGYIGGLVGYNEAVAGVNTSGTISGADHSAGAVYGQYYYVGGLVGYSDHGSITYSSNSSSVNGNSGSYYIGGLVGKTDGTTILNSTSSGDVGTSGVLYVGGLVGGATNTIIRSSTSTSKVNGVFYVGGLAGYGDTITISDSHHTTGDIGGSSSTFIGGLIGFGSNVDISNSSTSNGNVNGRLIVGGLAGLVSSGQISSSSSSVSISAGSSSGYVGGLVGQLINASITNSSSFSGSFTTPMYQNIGGLAGFAQTSTISDSWSTASVSGTSTSIDIGGLVGLSSNTIISNSYSSGIVSGNSRVGGLVGMVTDGGSITDSWSLGNVTTTGADISYIGGLVGFVDHEMYSSSIIRSYASGSVSGGLTAQFVGGLVGATGTDTAGASPIGLLTIAGSWSSGNISGGRYVGGLVGRSSAYITTDTSTGATLYSFSTGSVTGTGDYVGGLVGYDESVAGIANSGLISAAYHITGSVSGGNEVGGLVGYMTGSRIVSGSYASVQVNGANNVGGLVGHSGNASGIDLTFATGTVSGSANVGGLVGLNEGSSTIDRSYYQAESVTGHETTGGLVGRNTGSGSVITRSFSFGSVRADNTVGGLVGLNESGADVNNSYSWSEVTATNSTDAKAGGLVGSNASGATINNSYSTGLVTATGGNAGGLVGIADAATNVTNSFWDRETSGWMTSAAGTGLSTAQMKSFGTFSASSVGWDISKNYGQSNIWRIYDTDSYPLLHWYLIPLAGPYTVGSVTKTYNGLAFNGGSVSPALPAYAASDIFFGGSAQGAKNASTQPYAITLWSNIYDLNVTNGTLKIDPKALSISGSREYDGTTRFTSGNLSLTVSELVSGDATPVIGGYADVSSKNAGLYSSWSSSNLTLSDMNYTLNGGSVSARIDPKVLTISGSREYDGTTDFNGSVFGTVNGVMVGGVTETLTVSGTGTVGNRNATGSAQALSLGTLAFADGSGLSSNYTLSGGTGTITQKVLTISGSREYDGTADFNGSVFGSINTGVTLAGGGTEHLTVSGTGTVGNRNATGMAQTLTIGTLAFTDGSGLASNYALSGGMGEIRAKAVTLTGLTASDKEYDGTRSATLTGYAISGLVGSETLGVSGYTAEFDTKDTGTGKTVTVSGMTFVDGSNGGLASNYTVNGNSGSTKADITPKEVSIAANREYDGTTDFDGGLFGTVNGVTVGGVTETLTLSGKGSVSDRNVYSSTGNYNGAQALLTSGGTVAGLSLVGSAGVSASNYKLVGGTGEIRARAVTLTGVNAADKEYDGTRSATLTGYTISGLVGSETLGVSGYTAEFDTKDAGTGKMVTVSGMMFTDGSSGGVASNYTVDAPDLTTYAIIYPKALTIRANDAQKSYDGVAYTGGNGVSYDGFISGEDESVLAGMLAYGGSSQGAVDAGTYSIIPSGLSSGNYDISYASGVLNIITNEESYVYVTFDDDRNIWHSVEMIPSIGVRYEPMIVPGFVCVRDPDPLAMQ